MATFVMCWDSSARFSWDQSQGDLHPGSKDTTFRCLMEQEAGQPDLNGAGPQQAALEASPLALDKAMGGKTSQAALH